MRQQYFNELLAAGWKKAPYYYGMYSLVKTDSKGRVHQIQLDDQKRPHLVTIHRIETPGSILSDGYIGNFVGGRGDGKATSYKKYLNPKHIDNIPSSVDRIFKK